MTTTPELQPLCDAAEGLLMQSESDAPFVPCFWPDVKTDELLPERVREFLGAPADAKIELVSVQSFFRNATTEEDWHNAEEAATVQKFKTLVKTIKKTLRKPRVFCIGESTVECYILGEVANGVGGLKTQVVET
jgi:hypothetical protein